MPRKKISPDQRVEVTLTDRERTLICERTFAGPELTTPLRVAEVRGTKLVVRYTLDDLDELLGYVAAEANHAKSPRLAKELYRLCDHLRTTMESYDDGQWQSSF